MFNLIFAVMSGNVGGVDGDAQNWIGSPDPFRFGQSVGGVPAEAEQTQRNQ